MSAWHRPDVEAAAVEHLTAVVGPVSARQIVDGLLAKGRTDGAAEVERLRAQYAEAVGTASALEKKCVELERIANAEREHVAAAAQDKQALAMGWERARKRIAELEQQLTTAATAHTPGLCPPCKRGDCDECMAVDHPDLPSLYTYHYVPNPHQACREARRGGERS